MLMTSKADKLPLETEPVARDNNTIWTLNLVTKLQSRLALLIIVVIIHIRLKIQITRCKVVKFLRVDTIRVCDGRYGGSVEQSSFG